MIRISSSKIKEIANDLDGINIDGIHFAQEGEVRGIQAIFANDADDEEVAKAVVKKYLKENYPVLKIYIEVI